MEKIASWRGSLKSSGVSKVVASDRSSGVLKMLARMPCSAKVLTSVIPVHPFVS